jgi:hypothetical protein
MQTSARVMIAGSGGLVPAGQRARVSGPCRDMPGGFVTSQMLAAGGFVERCELGWRAAKLN